MNKLNSNHSMWIFILFVLIFPFAACTQKPAKKVQIPASQREDDSLRIKRMISNSKVPSFQMADDIKLEIGYVLPEKYISKEPRVRYATHSSQLDPFFYVIMQNIAYLVAYVNDSHQISYIATFSKDFKTEEGLQIGHEIEVTRSKIIAYPGWEVHAPKTKDGWRPVIGTALSYGNPLLSSEGSEVRKVKIMFFSKGR
jgi:hypothetical protein